MQTSKSNAKTARVIQVTHYLFMSFKAPHDTCRLHEAAGLTKELFCTGEFEKFVKSKSGQEVHDLYSLAEDVLVYLNELLQAQHNVSVSNEEFKQKTIHVYAVLSGVYFHEHAILNKGLYYWCTRVEKEPEHFLYRLFFQHRRQLHHRIMWSTLIQPVEIEKLISDFAKIDDI